MLDVPKRLLKESVVLSVTTPKFDGTGLYRVVEMQLSLMHDIFYTKRFLIHSNWYLSFIHMISTAATATALVLFHRVAAVWGEDKKGYDSMDVAVTYVLLVGAVIVETLSFLRATFSSWIYACNFWRVHQLVFSVRLLVHASDWRPRYWSASLGQHNLLQLSARSRFSRRSAVAR